MEVIGIDFTSRPSRGKPLTCMHGSLEGHVLHIDPDRFERWQTFREFEEALRRPGPWIAGIDFPFGQSRTFIENIGWPRDWSGYVNHAHSLGREGFRDKLDGYRATRRYGDKEHRRVTDIAAKSISPQKLYGVPVGLMFYEGAFRLLQSGVTIPMLQSGDPERVVVEAYPGVLARQLIGRDSYKNDDVKKQTEPLRVKRHAILNQILDGRIEASHGLRVASSKNLKHLAEDPTGDQLDSLLCAIQAAWAWNMRQQNHGAPACADTLLEGYIADPMGRTW
jgi:hypothetical protein